MAFKRMLVDSVDIYDAIIGVMTTNGWQNITTPGNGTPIKTAGLRTSNPGVTPETTTAKTSTTAAALNGFKYDWDVLKSISSGAIAIPLYICRCPFTDCINFERFISFYRLCQGETL